MPHKNFVRVFLISLVLTIFSTSVYAWGFSRHHPKPTIKDAISAYVFNSDIRIQRLLAYNGALLYRLGDNIHIVLPSDQFFLQPTSELNWLRYYVLDAIANFLTFFPDTVIHIEAFTDNVGSDEESVEVSRKKAERIKAYLWAHGIDERRLDATGYGRIHDVASNRTVHGSAMNRRVEIHFLSNPT